MGRLQRKKTSAGKKKKQQIINRISSSNAHIDDISKKASLISDSVKSIKNVSALPLKKSSSTGKSDSGKRKSNFMGRLFFVRLLQKPYQFLREVKIELNKVTWPTRKQTLGSTFVVIALVIIISFFLGMVDIGLSSLIGVLLK